VRGLACPGEPRPLVAAVRSPPPAPCRLAPTACAPPRAGCWPARPVAGTMTQAP